MATEFKDILVPIDFQESSLRASEYAIQLAKELQGKIHFMYVVRKLDYFSELLRSATEIDKITNLAKEKLTELATKFKSENAIECETHVVYGKVHEETVKKAKELSAAYIVIGDNKDEDGNQAPGSNLTQIISRSSCPVLISKYPYRHVFNKIIVPLDLSSETTRQIKNAVFLAKKYNASLHLVSALIAGIKHKKSRIYKKMDEIQKTLVENNIECTTKLFSKSEIAPYKLVLEHAYEIQADSILVMTHQEKRGDNYIGAFAQNLMIESKIPVLSLTASAGESENTETVMNMIDPFGIISGTKNTNEDDN